MGYGDARVRGNSERWKPPCRDEPSNSLPLSVFVFSILSCPLRLFSLSSSSLFISLSLPSYLPIYPSSFRILFFLPFLYPLSLSPASLAFLPRGSFHRLNQPAEETTRRGGGRGSRRGRRGRPEKDRREGERQRAVDEHKHGILSDVDVYVNAEYLMGCQKQSL